MTQQVPAPPGPRSRTTQARLCPVPGCGRACGVTRYGDPCMFCRRHWSLLDVIDRGQVWRAFRAWQRLERKWLSLLPELRPPALRSARAVSIQEYIDVRDECIRKLSRPYGQQLEVAL